MAMKKFKNAFARKWHELSGQLEVSLPLLTILYDHEVLSHGHFEKLKGIQENFEKVNKLLEILIRRDDRYFDVFCDDLDADGQSAIVEIIRRKAQPIADESLHNTRQLSVCVPHERLVQAVSSKQDEQTTELEELLEVDYGLHNVLCKNKLLTLSECQNIAQHRHDHRFEVQKRVSRLLKFAVEKLNKGNENVLKALNNTSFLRSLEETDQRHIVNFIEKDGSIESIKSYEDRPLNQHQRRSLHPHPEITERSHLNSQNPSLQKMLLDEEVITGSQREYIGTDGPLSTSNERLLSIMQRRSVANVVAFFRCLDELGCRSVARKLNVPGVCSCIRTTINSRTMTDRDKQKREKLVVERLNQSKKKSRHSEQFRKVKESLACLENKRCVVKYVESRRSIAWFIQCQTLDSLDSLRAMYNSNELAHVLHDIFNSMRGVHEPPLPLRVEWKVEDYEFCRTVFEKPSSQPFGAFSYNDELLLGATVRVQLFMCSHIVYQ